MCVVSCNCGSHKCPPDQHLHLLTPYEAELLRTSNQRDFPAHALSGVPSRDGVFKPKQEMMIGSGKFEGQSTCQSDFRAPAGAQRAQAIRPSVGLTDTLGTGVGGPDNRQWVSENRGAFDPKGVQVRKSFAPQGARHTTGMPFEGQSMSSTDYKQPVGAKPSTPFREQSTRHTGPDDRDFQTEAALKFVQHSDQRRQNFAPPPRSLEHNPPLESMTSNRADYPGWAGAPAARSRAPQQSHTAENETRDFKSQNAMDYGSKGYAVRESYKPAPGNLIQNQGVPFSGLSTTKADFQGAQGGRAQAIRPSVGLTDTLGTGVGGPDNRQWVSENRGAFDPKGVQVRQSFAPQGARHTTGLAFAGESVTASDYKQPVGAKPSTPFREQSTRIAGPDDRDFQTEAALKFASHGAQPRRQGFHPQDRDRGQSHPFEGISTTASDYKAWQRPGCPAHELPQGGVRGPDGHTLFVREEAHTGGRWTPYSPNSQQQQQQQQQGVPPSR